MSIIPYLVEKWKKLFDILWFFAAGELFQQRLTKVMCIILSILFFISIGCCPAQAAGFIQETLSPEEEKTVRQNSTFTKLDKEPGKDMINCFDVNKDGMIAVGTSSRTKRVVIYNSNNEFVTGYEFDDPGSFGVEWFYDELCIYCVRSGLMCSGSDVGSVDSVIKIANDIPNDPFF